MTDTVAAFRRSLTVAGAVLGALADGGRRPALPWLNSGAIAGFAAGTVVMLLI